MKEELFSYLKSFMTTNEWTDGVTPKQARAIFTTLCLVGYIDADTSACDYILLRLYNETGLEEIMEYDEFEMFMVELIV